MVAVWFVYTIEAILLRIMRGNEIVLPDAVYVFLIIIDSLLIVVTLSKYEKCFSVNAIFGLLLRLAFLFWVEYCSSLFALPNTGYDEVRFYWNGYSHLVNGTQFSGYAGFVSILFSFIGASKLFGSFLNVICSIQTMVFVYKTIELLGYSEDTKKKAMFLFCLTPNYALSSAILLRESPMIMFSTLSLYFFIRWWINQKTNDLLKSILVIVPAIYFHSGYIAVAMGYVCVVFALTRKQFGKHISIFSLKTISFLALASIVGLFLIPRAGVELSTSTFIQASSTRETGGSAYNANIFTNDTTIGFVGNSPVHMVYLLLSPLPWQWRGFGDVLSFILSSAVYSIILLKAFKAHGYSDHVVLAKGMVIIVLFFLFVFGWGTSNAGTALRHRDKALGFYTIMYAALIEERFRGSGNNEMEYYA